jgi:hypothetical protein
MRRIAFNPRFVNEAGNDLIAGKITTIRKNYWFWKQFEGQDAALYTWEGKPYRSKQRVFCVKRIVSVEKVEMWLNETHVGDKLPHIWYYPEGFWKNERVDRALLAKNDGFESEEEFINWFWNYPVGDKAVVHFSEFRYG